MARRNAIVVFACRDEKKTLNIIREIGADTYNKDLVFMRLNL